MFLQKMEEKFVPLLMKISENKRLIAIRDGMSLTIPFTIIGSIFLIIANLPLQAWMDFIAPVSGVISAPVNVTFGVLGLISVIGISYNLAKGFQLEPITNTIIAVLAFLLATSTEEFSINVDSLGATGMFTGIIIALLTTEIHRFFVKRNIVIKMPEGVPSAVSHSFASLFPAAAMIALVWIIRVVLGIELNAIIQTVFSPLVYGLSTLPGLLIYALLACMLWVVGIHGDHALAGVATPIFLANLAANTAAFQAGDQIPNIVVDGFWIIFMCLGGTGSTLGLVLAMVRSKAKRYRTLGRLSLPSAVFCINEPVIFGFPIVMNPMMMIPFIATPMLLGGITYLLMSFGIIGKIVFLVPWTTPPVLNTFLATSGDIPATVWSLISVAVSYFIYLPFFKIAEKKELQDEAILKENAAASEKRETAQV